MTQSQHGCPLCDTAVPAGQGECPGCHAELALCGSAACGQLYPRGDLLLVLRMACGIAREHGRCTFGSCFPRRRRGWHDFTRHAGSHVRRSRR